MIFKGSLELFFSVRSHFTVHSLRKIAAILVRLCILAAKTCSCSSGVVTSRNKKQSQLLLSMINFLIVLCNCCLIGFLYFVQTENIFSLASEFPILISYINFHDYFSSKLLVFKTPYIP